MKIHFKKLDHFQLCIPPGTEDQARQFYTQKIGLTEIEKPEPLKPNGGLWYRIANIELHLGVDPTLERTKGHPAFEVENIEAVKAFLKKQNVRTKETTAIEGVDRFFIYDPFGNRIELLEKK